MGTITETLLTGSGVRALTETTLTSSDTFTYRAAGQQVLTLRNPTAGALSPTITGSSAASFAVDGYGAVDPSGGLAVGSIAAGAHKVIPLDKVSKYLSGTITVASGTGLVATLTGY